MHQPFQENSDDATRNSDQAEEDQIIEHLSDEGRGTGQYDPYMYLWHLAAIGVLTVDGPLQEDYRVTDALWSDASLQNTVPAKVAIIDTGLADHPNLAGRIIKDLSVDFGSDEGGAVYRESPSGEASKDPYAQEKSAEPPIDREPREKLSALSDRAELRAALGKLSALTDSDFTKVVELLEGRIKRGAAVRFLSVQDQRYPAHGTATAGMVVGSPIIVKGAFDPETLPYFGVDPFSKVFSIATSFEPEPVQLIFALIYAVANDADVILMPRGIDNPYKAPRMPKNEEPVSRTRYDGAKDDWELLDRLIVNVSRKIPIVVAAGNDGDDRLVYPASLAAEADKIGENGLITVGAVTTAGRRAGYSNYGEGLTVVAPSNDSRVYTRHQMRIDPRARTTSSHNFTIHGSLEGRYVSFSPEAPLTLDIPGPRGFRGATVATNPQSANYTLFSGTSAASAIVAGVLALMRRADRDKVWSGVRAKKALAGSASKKIFDKDLRIDISNEGDEGKISGATKDAFGTLQFGAGLVNARQALGELPTV